MIGSLPLFHQIRGQSVLVLGDGEAAEPKKRLVERAGGIVISDMQQAVDEGVRIAFVAYDDASACEAAAINLRCAGLLVNVVDKPDLCDFTTPSILDRDPVLIAVGTGGASAGLAKHVRLRLERILPQSLGKLANALFAARPALRTMFPDAADRRRGLDDALREGGALDALDGESHERLDDWLAGADATKPSETAEFTLTSADPEDLTLRQARALGEADAVCAIGPVPDAIMARARADAIRITCDAENCANARRSDGADANNTAAAPRCPVAEQRFDNQDAGRTLTVILRFKI
ncbi:MAG: NAD(P)-dependent oxidoreductase [Erythrobacter sp.]